MVEMLSLRRTRWLPLFFAVAGCESAQLQIDSSSDPAPGLLQSQLPAQPKVSVIDRRSLNAKIQEFYYTPEITPMVGTLPDGGLYHLFSTSWTHICRTQQNVLHDAGVQPSSAGCQVLTKGETFASLTSNGNVNYISQAAYDQKVATNTLQHWRKGYHGVFGHSIIPHGGQQKLVTVMHGEHQNSRVNDQYYQGQVFPEVSVANCAAGYFEGSYHHCWESFAQFISLGLTPLPSGSQPWSLVDHGPIIWPSRGYPAGPRNLNREERLVLNYYRHLLGWTVTWDFNGVSTHIAILRDQGCEADARLFLASPSFPQGLSDAEFVTRLYRAALAREPDAQGLAWWVAQLQGGWSRDTLVTQFFASAEAQASCTAGGSLGVPTVGTGPIVAQGSGFYEPKLFVDSNNMYVFYTNSNDLTPQRNPNHQYQCITAARAPVSTGGVPGSWQVLRQGSFSANALPSGFSKNQMSNFYRPGAGGYDTWSSCLFTDTDSFTGKSISFNVAKVEGHNLYVGAEERAKLKSDGTWEWQVGLRFSDNLTQWTSLFPLALGPGQWGSGWYAYPTFLSADGRSNRQVHPQGFYLLGKHATNSAGYELSALKVHLQIPAPTPPSDRAVRLAQYYYLALLGWNMPETDSGVQTHANTIRTQGCAADLALFVSSAPFQQRKQWYTNQQYVELLYEAILARRADGLSNGSNWWRARLEDGTYTRDTIVGAMSGSAEAQSACAAGRVL